MSGNEGFLARWSKLKRAAAEGAAAATPAAGETAAHVAAETPVVDLTQLPPLESIGSGTDVRAFLRAGVPQPLVRAALRRAWETDPSIRDFIGIAENQWDFTAGDAIPGFGPLDAGQAARALAAMLPAALVTGEPGEPDSSLPGRFAPPLPEAPEAARFADPVWHAGAPAAPAAPVAHSGDGPAAEGDPDAPAGRRLHGTALPR